MHLALSVGPTCVVNLDVLRRGDPGRAVFAPVVEGPQYQWISTSSEPAMTARLRPCRPAGDPEPHFPVPREGGLLVSVDSDVATVGDSRSGTPASSDSLQTRCPYLVRGPVSKPEGRGVRLSKPSSGLTSRT